jgi:hypothetical protein
MRMKYLGPFRVATYLLVLFCFGHTVGGMLSHKSLGPQADAVLAQMRAVHFAFHGGDCTWYGFYFGFGMTTSLFLVLSAVIAWCLASVPARGWPSVAPIAWALVASHAANTWLSWRYFFPGPVVISGLVTLLLAVGAWRSGRAAAAAAT